MSEWPPTGTSSSALLNDLESMCHGLGFSYWSYYHARSDAAHEPLYRSNLPAPLHRWANSNLEGIFAALRPMAPAQQPVAWNREQLERHVTLAPSLSLTQPIDGLSVVLPALAGDECVFSVMRFDQPLGSDEVASKAGHLCWLAGHVQQALQHIHTLPDLGDWRPLTARQREVMQLVVTGLTAQQIAETLQVSRRTVRFHQEEVMLRLQASNITAAAYRAGRLGLL